MTSSDPAESAFDRSIAALIDHTVLKADATRRDIEQVCEEALRYGFASVCVNGSRVKLAAELLAGSSVRVCTVIGFPLGAMSNYAKDAEAGIAMRDGAVELDMVIDIGSLKDGEHEAVRSDIAGVVVPARNAGALVKVIIETSLLSDDEKRTACRIAVDAGAQFVKTSTGFSGSGATTADVTLIREVVGPQIGVKASGGIRTLADLRSMLGAGASRIGASASVRIVEETRR
ncbi:MAG TPA: deoxyribose-phosphate aldolase [Bryobacteraceae bacterium]|nr:deoxyribose-phosphate aldolase [Bryobacteraceae bacterium]